MNLAEYCVSEEQRDLLDGFRLVQSFLQGYQSAETFALMSDRWRQLISLKWF